MIASAPGKLMLTGEFAVLAGAPALMLAVDRRAVAREAVGAGSPFLAAIAEELAARGLAMPVITVDSAAFYTDHCKLGLGSSAAVTVAATALALALARPAQPASRADILEIALAAHARAQRARGAAGSGADIAAAVHGGALAYTMGAAVAPVAWPAALALVPFFTGGPADTVALVTAVDAARRARPAAVDAALAAIADASRAACRAPSVAALAAAADATDQLAAATGVALVPPCVTAARRALQELGGTAKTTGAGGGDVAVAVVPAAADLAAVRARLVAAGGQPLAIRLDDRGVDTRPAAQ